MYEFYEGSLIKHLLLFIKRTLIIGYSYFNDESFTAFVSFKKQDMNKTMPLLDAAYVDDSLVTFH